MDLLIIRVLRKINWSLSSIIHKMMEDLPVRDMWKIQSQFEKDFDIKMKQEQKICEHQLINVCKKCGYENTEN